MSGIEINTQGREAVIKMLHTVLERDNSLSRCCAVRALDKMRAADNESVSRLVAALREDPDPDVRMDAAMVLGHLRAAGAVEALIRSLKHDPEGEVRIQAVEALSRIGGQRVVDVLIECLDLDGEISPAEEFGDDMEFSADWEIQGKALAALGDTGDERAVEPVIRLIENEEYEDLHELGFRVLAKLSGARAREFILKALKDGGRLTRRRAAKGLLHLKDADAVDESVVRGLTGALLDREPSVRIYAAKALAEIGAQDEHVVVPLTMLLSDPDREVSNEAAALLGRMRGREVADRVLELLESSGGRVKRQVVQVLGNIGDDSAVEDLTELLDSGDDDLIYDTIEALGRIGSPVPAERIALILADKGADTDVRVQAARALSMILRNREEDTDRDGAEQEPPVEDIKEEDDGSDEEEENNGEGIDPVEVLKNSVHDTNRRVSFAALASLVEIDPERSTRTLVGLLRGDTENQGPGEALDRARNSGCPKEDEGSWEEDAVEEIISGMDDEAPGKDEISTLASIMASKAEKEVSREPAGGAVKSPADTHLKIFAARLLGAVEDPGSEAVDALVEAAGTPDVELRKEAVTALGSIGDGRGLSAVVDSLKSDSKEVRLAALNALEGFSSVPDIEKICADMLGDADAYVRLRTIQILGSLGGCGAVEAAAALLNDEDRGVRREVLKVLPEMGGEALSERISTLIFENAGDLRQEAAAALRRLGCFTVAGSLIETLNDMEEEENHWICIDALAELFRSGDTDGRAVTGRIK